MMSSGGAPGAPDVAMAVRSPDFSAIVFIKSGEKSRNDDC
jgi:hypothetical protein